MNTLLNQLQSQMNPEVFETMKRLKETTNKNIEVYEKSTFEYWERYYSADVFKYAQFLQVVNVVCPTFKQNEKLIGGPITDAWRQGQSQHNPNGIREFFYNPMGDDNRSGCQDEYLRLAGGFPVANMDYEMEIVVGYDPDQINEDNPDPIKRTITLKKGDEIKPELFGMDENLRMEEDRTERRQENKANRVKLRKERSNRMSQATMFLRSYQ